MDLEKHKPKPLSKEEIKEIEYQNNFEIFEEEKKESKAKKRLTLK